MRFPSVLPVAALLALGVTACTEPPTAPVDRDPVTAEALPPGWVEVDFTTFDTCNGEFVDFTTRRTDRVSLKADGAGGFHFSLHRTWIGTGVGQATGTEYNLNWPHELSENVKPPFPYTFTRMIANNLVSKGDAENRIFRLVQHATINANGEVSVVFGKSTLECVG